MSRDSKKTGGFWDFISKHWGEVLSISHLSLMALRGGEPPEGASAEFKELSKGLFGLGDEVGLLRILRRFDHADHEKAEKLLGFLRWHFPIHHDKWYIRLLAGLRLSKWRVLVTELDTKPRKRGEEKLVVQHKDTEGKTHTSTTTIDVTSAADKPETFYFFEKIIEIIETEEGFGGTREDGYRKVVEHFKLTGVPTMLDTYQFEEKLEQLESLAGEMPETIKNIVDGTNTAIDSRYEAIREENRRRKPLMRFLRSLLGEPK